MLPAVAPINKLPVIAFTTGVFTLAAEVILPVADIKPPVNMLPPVMLAALVIVEVALINPLVNTLPPVTLPVTDAKPPVNKLPPVMLAALVIVEVALIRPPVSKLPPVTLPFALNSPVMYSPVVANTATFDVPFTLTVTLALAEAMFTFDVPLLMLATDVIIPVKK